MFSSSSLWPWELPWNLTHGKPLGSHHVDSNYYSSPLQACDPGGVWGPGGLGRNGRNEAQDGHGEMGSTVWPPVLLAGICAHNVRWLPVSALHFSMCLIFASVVNSERQKLPFFIPLYSAWLCTTHREELVNACGDNNETINLHLEVFIILPFSRNTVYEEFHLFI